MVQNTAKMNMDQMIAKKTQAKDLVKQIHQEGAELEAQIQEIKDNHESIQVELEISEQLEKEFVFNDFCGANFAKYLVKETKSQTEGKVLVFLKPCRYL